MAVSNETVYSVREVADYMTTSFWGGASYTFDLGAERVIAVDLTELSSDARQLATWALEAWTTATAIGFREDPSNARLSFTESSEGALTSSRTLGPDLASATVNVSEGWLERFGVSFGSYSMMTYIHEIGHALGLGHPSNYEDGRTYGVDNDFANDSWQMSALSYFSQTDNTFIDASYAFAMTPMPADVAATEMLYGAVPLRTGDTTYGDGSTAGGSYDRISAAREAGQLENEVAWTIVDSGGYDTLNVSSSSADQTIDLRPEHFSDVYGLTGNLAIAEGSTIEEVRTGAGNDFIVARVEGILVVTGDGRDTVQGGAGNDTISGSGIEKNTFLGNGGRDVIRAGDGDDMLAGGPGNDALYGGNGNNMIYLGLGDDLAGGGGGNDTLYGGDGANQIYGGLGNDTVVGGPGDEIIIGGGNGRNALLGNAGNDSIRAGQGSDMLAGGPGDDQVFGGDGDNAIYLGLGNDFSGGGAGNDLIIAGAGSNTIYGGLGDDRLQSGVGKDILSGGPGADLFVFTSAASIGIGAQRDVIVDFEQGNDRLDFSSLGLRLVGSGGGEDETASGDLFVLSGFVAGDVDRDGTYDFALRLFGAPALTAEDFIL